MESFKKWSDMIMAGNRLDKGEGMKGARRRTQAGIQGWDKDNAREQLRAQNRRKCSPSGCKCKGRPDLDTLLKFVS